MRNIVIWVILLLLLGTAAKAEVIFRGKDSKGNNYYVEATSGKRFVLYKNGLGLQIVTWAQQEYASVYRFQLSGSPADYDSYNYVWDSDIAVHDKYIEVFAPRYGITSSGKIKPYTIEYRAYSAMYQYYLNHIDQ